MSNDPIRRPGESMTDTIDRLLRERRPNRFTMSGDHPDEDDCDSGEVIRDEWLDRIATDVAAEVRPEERPRAVLVGLRQQVRTREGTACRSVNNELRRYCETGQWPLFDITEPSVNGHLLDLPLGVVTRYHQRRGRVKVLSEHVALRAVTSDDLRKFAQEERRRAADEFGSRNKSCAGAEALADEMDESGAATFGDWWRAPPDAEDE